jgi:phosphohistidine phosphatase
VTSSEVAGSGGLRAKPYIHRMGRQLWFLRHGEAEPHDARPDAERRLTQRGEKQSRAAGRALAALGLEFQLVVTSPRVRAFDSARLACAALRAEPLVDDRLGDGLGADAALEHAYAAGADKRILFVGHEPDLSRIVGDLTGGQVELKKGGVAGVRLHGRVGELIVLMRPRELDRIG